jgi:acetyltransferase
MSLLSPCSVAVIGASSDEKKVGHIVLKNIITQGFAGEIYPINPKGGELLGKKVYAALAEISSDVDLAVIVTPAGTVPALADECGTKKVKTLVVITAGFGETGTEEGHQHEAQLVKIAERYGMQLIGPNCLGVLRPSIGLNASFANNVKKPGNVALLSQSGAMAVALMDASASLGLNFSLMVSMGNKAATDECDLLELCLEDDETKVVGLYLENIRYGQKFLRIAAQVAAKKPIVLIKSGTSETGKRAVSSHTGALAGSDAAIDAVCAQTGIHRAKTTSEFLDMLRVLSTQPILPSPQIAVITNAGGPGILATDEAERVGLQLVSLDAKNADKLKKALPPAASVKNPIDVLGDALGDRYTAAIDAAAKDPNIEGLVTVLTPQVMTPVEEIATAIATAKKKYRLFPIVASFMGQESIGKAVEILQAGGVPNFDTPEAAVRALSALQFQKPKKARKPAAKLKATAPVQSLLAGRSGLLPEDVTQELFSIYGLPTPSQALATNVLEAKRLTEQLGFPLIAKISSPQILHKTDIGGVRANLKTIDEAEAAFTEIMENAKKHQPDADLKGVLLQKFLPAGDEFIVGALDDPSFGKLVMVGLGGIYTELFRDTCFRIAPVTEQEAYEMLQSLTSWTLLLGMRGKKQADIDQLAKIIVAVSKLVTDCPQITELDLNPIIVKEESVVIADAKVIVH